VACDHARKGQRLQFRVAFLPDLRESRLLLPYAFSPRELRHYLKSIEEKAYGTQLIQELIHAQVHAEQIPARHCDPCHVSFCS
jgi:hypothetical protein